MKFVCLNCNYRFESETDQIGKPCPYCSKPQVIKEPSAEDLLNETN